jgi:hypothetical protein
MTGTVLLGVLYLVMLVTLGLMPIRKGPLVMFSGIFIPVFCLIGAIMPRSSKMPVGVLRARIAQQFTAPRSPPAV